ncbi:predicted protein [Histoplasma capsulatum H143]|uniref:Uncharacterized protein n=1 Tax=Ajellomyces capsulatus (strain H143) TaxID=544712 RepID=C6H8N6_AJECH|nr:predicted protein [Histoplasma capsulatum H143]
MASKQWDGKQPELAGVGFFSQVVKIIRDTSLVVKKQATPDPVVESLQPNEKAHQYTNLPGAIPTSLRQNTIARSIRGGTPAVANFSGSAIDGSMAQVGYAARIQCPQSLSENLGPVSVKQDLFALGTVPYETSIGTKMFPNITSRGIEKRFGHREYHDMGVFPQFNVRQVIPK